VLQVQYSLVSNLDVDTGDERGQHNLDGEDGHHTMGRHHVYEKYTVLGNEMKGHFLL